MWCSFVEVEQKKVACKNHPKFRLSCADRIVLIYSVSVWCIFVDIFVEVEQKNGSM